MSDDPLAPARGILVGLAFTALLVLVLLIVRAWS